MSSATMRTGPLPPPKPDHTYTMVPKGNKVHIFFWRQKMWFESTFAFSMLEPWEKILLWTVITTLFGLLLAGVVQYLPQHLSDMLNRSEYYLWGQEGDERVLRQWITRGVGSTSEKISEAINFVTRQEL